MLLEEAGGGALPRVAVVVSGQHRQAGGVAGEGVERFARAGEFLGVAELGQVARADGVIGPLRDGGDPPQGLLGAVEEPAPSFPQLHGGESAKRPQLVEGAPAPAAQLHVRVREVDELHRSATAIIPRPPKASSSRRTRRPASSSARDSSTAVSAP
jgi:hypothetical protein